MNRIIPINKGWKVENNDKTMKFSADMPSTVFEILEKENITNIFYGKNEKNTAWIYNDSWFFIKDFDAEQTDIENNTVYLSFYGIDTFSNIYINKVFVGKTDNMFLKYKFEINKFIHPGKNTIEVEIESPVKKADEIDDVQLKIHKFSIPGVEKIRKAPYSFGWDWGPIIPDMGIWKDVEIEFKNTFSIPDYYLTTDYDNETDTGYINIKFDAEAPENFFYKIIIENPSGKNICSEFIKKELHIKIKNPDIWWIKELGTPNLYRLKIELYDSGTLSESASFSFGIRRIKLVKNPDQWGESFYFELNGIPVFAKGANFIPTDSVLTRGKKLSLYKKLVDDSAEANFNMLRLWGGGIYEDEELYKLCDEKGILLWQDMIFACKPQPIYSEFTENIKKETEYNIKRLRNFTSLSIWVGNNEIETAWADWGWKYIFEEKFMKKYTEIFENILPDIVKKYDPERFYWPSSPSGGGNFINPNDMNSGDSHYWEVWHNSKPLTAYREFNSRFMSEFGFESFPDIKTIKTFCEEKDFDFYSEIMENHQKNEAGNKKIFDYMNNRFSIPKKFADQVTVSQLTQAEAMEYGVEHWRRLRNDNRCMGALYWQLNDCWPVASWSSIDYYGRWKALHYFAKRFYSTLLPSINAENKSLEFWITNDYYTDRKGIYSYKIFDISSRLIKDFSLEITAKKLFSEKIADIPYNGENLYIFCSFESEGKIYRNSKLTASPKDYHLTKPEISFKLEKTGFCSYTLTLKSNNISLYTFIEADFDFKASDNYFNMYKDQEIILEIFTENDYEKDFLSQNIFVKSLYDFIY